MRYCLAISAAFILLLSAESANAAVPGGGTIDDDKISLIYDPGTGDLSIDAAGQQWSTLEITSASGLFTGTPAAGLVLPPFDVFSPTKYFLLKTAGMGDTHLGQVLPTGINLTTLGDDLTVNGSVLPRGNINDAQWGPVDLVWIPEPASMLLLGLGMASILTFRRGGKIH